MENGGIICPSSATRAEAVKSKKAFSTIKAKEQGGEKFGELFEGGVVCVSVVEKH